MRNISAWPAGDMEKIMQNYGNTLFRLCLVMLGNASDAEDVVQETLLKYLLKSPKFEDTEHEKAWLITVARNKCKDILRFKSKHPIVDMEEIKELTKGDTDSTGILEVLMTLPDKFRMVLVLYYVEEYSIESIAQMIGKTTSAVKMRLQKGRRLLEEAYKRECM